MTKSLKPTLISHTKLYIFYIIGCLPREYKMIQSKKIKGMTYDINTARWIHDAHEYDDCNSSILNQLHDSQFTYEIKMWLRNKKYPATIRSDTHAKYNP